MGRTSAGSRMERLVEELSFEPGDWSEIVNEWQIVRMVIVENGKVVNVKDTDQDRLRKMSKSLF